MEQVQKFDHRALLKSLQETKESLPSLKPEAFYDIMLEFGKIFRIMGSSLDMAYREINGKVGMIKRNYGQLQFNGGIMDFVKFEQAEKITVLNGLNNELAPDPKYGGYESTARTLLRLMWFLDFLSSFVGQLESDRKVGVSSACRKAYDVSLASRHPLPVRMAAKAAMTFAPGRKTILGGLFPKDLPDEEKYAAIKQMMELVEPVRKHLWDYYQSNGLADLP